jgi:hypothetical protein
MCELLHIKERISALRGMRAQDFARRLQERPGTVRRQVRFDPLPLLIAQPKQVSAHDSKSPFQKRIRIVLSERKN